MIKKESVINAVKHWCKLTPIIGNAILHELNLLEGKDLEDHIKIITTLMNRSQDNSNK